MDLGSELMLMDCKYYVGNQCVGLRVPYARCSRYHLELKLGKWKVQQRTQVAGMPVKEIRGTNPSIEILYYAAYATVRLL